MSGLRILWFRRGVLVIIYHVQDKASIGNEVKKVLVCGLKLSILGLFLFTS